MNKSFYHFVLTFRGGDWSDQKSRFAESAFFDHGFPKTSTSFEEISSYIETKADEALSTAAFDELWDIYRLKYEI
ncbi:MAG TPA: YozE family protein [Ureibacillus sp.]|nr:YozE family protein [Ureibacillus sp.]